MIQIIKFIGGSMLMIWFIVAQSNGKTLFGSSSRNAVRSGYGRVVHK
jgi:hypothetical protein